MGFYQYSDSQYSNKTLLIAYLNNLLLFHYDRKLYPSKTVLLEYFKFTYLSDCSVRVFCDCFVACLCLLNIRFKAILQK